MMLNNKMFHREHQYQETVKGSGAGFVGGTQTLLG